MQCSTVFPEDAASHKCAAEGSKGVRYKGSDPETAQLQKPHRPKCFSLIADIAIQLRSILEKGRIFPTAVATHAATAIPIPTPAATACCWSNGEVIFRNCKFNHKILFYVIVTILLT